MTVTAQTPITNATGNGVAVAFNTAWFADQAGDVVVKVDGTTKALTTDYTLSGLGGAGFTVTFVTAPANGAAVLIYRDTAITRSVDYQNNGDLRAATVNSDMDRPVRILQEVVNGAKISPRAVRAPAGESLNDLPASASRANTFLRFDATGQPVAYGGDPTDATQLAADLANTASGKGASLVGSDLFNLNYVNTTIGGAVQGGMPSIFWALTDAEIADVEAFTYSNDLTTKIQACLDKWPHWWLPPGGYKISTLLLKSNNIRLFGAGQGVTILKSTVTAVGATAIKNSDQTVTRLWCGLENLTVQADSLAVGYTIDWKSMQLGMLRNVWVYGGGSGCYGIRLEANWGTTECTYNEITHCYIGNIGKGISWGDGANSNTVIATRVQPLATGYGFFLSGTAAARVSNNTIIGGGVEYTGAVSRGVFAGTGVDVLTLVGIRFEQLAVAIETTAAAKKVMRFGNYYDSNTANYALAGTDEVGLEEDGLTLPNITISTANNTTLAYFKDNISFTPVIKGSTTAGTGTYVVQTGSATRIGNRCFFELQVQISAHTGTGNMIVDGLPFTQKNAASNYTYHITGENLTFAGTLKSIGFANTTQVGVYSETSGGALAAVAMDTVCSIYLSGSFPI